MKYLITLIFLSITSFVFSQDTVGYRVNSARPKQAMQHKDLSKAEIESATTRFSIKDLGLQTGAKFNAKLFEPTIPSEELDNKKLLLIFWAGDCDNCSENMTRLNPQFRALMRENKSVLISVTPENKNNALEIQRYTPIEHTDMISNAKPIIDKIGIKDYPAFIVTDERHQIKLSLSGNDPKVYQLLRHYLIENTTQNKTRVSP